MAPIYAGRVKTTWKYGTGRSSASRSSSHCRAAAPDIWGNDGCGRIVGDPLMSAVLAALDVSAERGRAAGLDRRHDLNWARLTCPALAFRHAAPWARKTSATSREAAPCGRGQSAGFRFARLTPSRSSGLLTSRIVLTATRV